MFVLFSNTSVISVNYNSFLCHLKLKQLVTWNSYKHGILAFYMKDKLKPYPLYFKENKIFLILTVISVSLH